MLVHSALADARMWEPLIPWFQGHEPISYDLRGHGQMDEADEDFHHVDDLLDLLGGEPAVLVGAGMGGRVALEAAVLQPELVLGLVLIGASRDSAESSELVTAMRNRALAVQAALGFEESRRVAELAAQLPTVDCPVLVLVGVDAAREWPATGHELAAAIPGARLEEHDGPGDPLADPGAIGRRIARFLERLS